MKNILNLLLSSFFIAVTFLSCKKGENKIFFEGGTAPVLTSSVASPDLPLSYANKDNEALKLSWTNPDYKFTTGISSQDVNYQIEIDTTGANFTNPNKQTVSVSKDLSKSFKVSEFNGYLLNQLQLDTSVSHNIEIRIKSFLGDGSVVLYSNVLKYAVVPYAIPPVVTPPSSGTLYLVGGPDIMDGNNWNNSNPFLPGYQFTRESATLYTITVSLSGGDNTSGDDQFLFIPVAGDWSHKYACKKTADQSPDGGDFGYDFSDNFPGPEASGTYKIEVDFQRGKYTVKKQ